MSIDKKRDVEIGDLSSVNVERETRNTRNAAAHKRQVKHAPESKVEDSLRIKRLMTPMGDKGVALTKSVLPIVLILFLASIAFWYQQQQISQLQLSREEINQSTSDFESRLAQTDDSINKTGNKAASRLKFLESEIRKLWELSNKRNKKEIEKNKAKIVSAELAVASVKKSVISTKSALGALQSTQNQESKLFLQMETRLSLMADSVSLLEQSWNKVSGRVGKLEKSQGTVTIRKDLNVVMQQVKDGNQELKRRITTNEQAIEAIDAHRRQVNTVIEKMSAQLESR